jgi:hypothetical protein
MVDNILLSGHLANLVDLIERIKLLTLSIEENSTRSNELMESTNKLTRRIGFLTWLIFGVSIIGLGIATYATFFKT